MVFCESHGIAVEGYSPLTKAYRLSDPVFVDMAEVYGKTVPQVNPCGPCVAPVWPLCGPVDEWLCSLTRLPQWS